MPCDTTKVSEKQPEDPVIQKVTLLQSELDSHIEEFHKHVEEEHERWNHLISVQEQNNAAIAELTASTRDLVEAWNTATGVVKAGATLGRFGKWLASIAIFGVIFTWLIEHWKS